MSIIVSQKMAMNILVAMSDVGSVLQHIGAVKITKRINPMLVGAIGCHVINLPEPAPTYDCCISKEQSHQSMMKGKLSKRDRRK